ncbi:letm-1 [Pristionchus pacificus]|uniref:Letm-1 n=1 Tax=Pristionchus pacificus TaxID=54126 RepID=A0A2A6CAP9_PRIPA|nr:letm-1 [Pristionchus pacificus]|eukprot:PDM75170.1 letm-1 [Pristionchus pacificus]
MIVRHSRINYIAHRTIVSFANRPNVLFTGQRTAFLNYNRQTSDLLKHAIRFAATDRSKVESTLKMLKDDLTAMDDAESKRLKLVPRKENEVKLTRMANIKAKIIHEAKHYYHGFRLLALETKLSAKYLWRIMRGHSLTRRERQQMVRTVSDLFRLVPFSIFIIVPFMELALPIFIKLFPNMLPSTFQEHDKEEEKLRKQVKVKVEMAKFLQDTIEEIALERKKRTTGDQNSKALEFAQFIKKSRMEGGYVSNKDLFKFSKLFEDELTLDNLSMSQLRALCRLLNVPPLGSPEILRFQLNMKLRELKADDKQIAAEGGVDALTTLDLQQACRARGMRAIGLSEQRLKEQLNQWLELSLSDKVPPSLLLLSRALYLPEDIPFTDRLKSLVSQLPEGIAEQTRQKLTEMEGGVVDHKARIALIMKIEEAIGQEKLLAADVDKKKKKAEEEAKRAAEEEAAAVGAKEAVVVDEKAPTIDVAALAAKAAADAPTATPKPELAAEALKAAATVIAQTVADAAKKEEVVIVAAVDAIKKELNKNKDEIPVDKKDLSALEDLLMGGPLHEAKHDITELKEQISEHTEAMNALDGAFAESKVAKRLRSKVEAIVQNVDSLVTKLEEKKQIIDETIADPTVPDAAKDKREKQVRVTDVIDRLKKIRKDYAEAESEKLEALIKAMDEDLDGLIDSDVVLEVIGLLEKHSDVSISPSQLASMIEVLKKEDRAEALQQAMGEAVLSAPITVQGSSDSPSPASPLVPPPDIDPKLTTPQQQKNGVAKQPKQQI